jgi:hypothetical protein
MINKAWILGSSHFHMVNDSAETIVAARFFVVGAKMIRGFARPVRG